MTIIELILITELLDEDMELVCSVETDEDMHALNITAVMLEGRIDILPLLDKDQREVLFGLIDARLEGDD